MDFSTIEITSKKIRGNNVGFSTIEITSKKVRGNHVEFSTSEITSKKVRGNHVKFSTSEITPKKVRGNDVETRRNLVFDVSTQYPRRINVDSTWCARWIVSLKEGTI